MSVLTRSVRLREATSGVRLREQKTSSRRSAAPNEATEHAVEITGSERWLVQFPRPPAVRNAAVHSRV